MRLRHLLIVLAVAMFGVVAAVPAFATEAEAEEPAVDEGVISDTGIVPAVEAPPTAEEETDLPWTQRFLAPTVLALGVLGIIGSMLYYGVRIRGKYKVAS